MPIDYKKYHPDWKEIAASIRERDGNACKFCGVPNYAIIRIHPFIIDGLPIADIVDQPPFSRMKTIMGESEILKISDREASRYALAMLKDGLDFKVSGFKYTRIVLTVAHLDHNIENNATDNLAALCQKCHLRYDAKHHAKNSKATREAKKQAVTRQINLFD